MPLQRDSSKVIWLQAQAPAKPPVGEACNGCGVCCAAETCPVSRVFLWQWRGSCRALEWHADVQQYRCGMLSQPSHYLPFLPRFLKARFQRWIKRWIAADTVCDSPTEAAAKVDGN